MRKPACRRATEDMPTTAFVLFCWLPYARRQRAALLAMLLRDARRRDLRRVYDQPTSRHHAMPYIMMMSAAMFFSPRCTCAAHQDAMMSPAENDIVHRAMPDTARPFRHTVVTPSPPDTRDIDIAHAHPVTMLLSG